MRLGGLYLNLRGREREGIVEPGAEAERLLEEIVLRLEATIDPAVGTRAIKYAYRADQIYHGDHAASGPDIVLGYHRGWRGGRFGSYYTSGHQSGAIVASGDAKLDAEGRLNVARKLAASFTSTGTPSHFIHPVEAAHGDLGIVRGSGDTSQFAAMLAFAEALVVWAWLEMSPAA